MANTPEGEQDLGWSPDGKQIVMEVNIEPRQIFVMDSDGENRLQLTDETMADNQQPSFCPDGRIAFTSGRDGNGEVYLMDADGSNQTRITNHAATDREPTLFSGQYANRLLVRSGWGSGSLRYGH